MNYWYYLEGWIDLLYETKNPINMVRELDRTNGDHDTLIRNTDTEMFRNTINLNFNKYYNIVKASGSNLLLGIQPYNLSPKEPMKGPLYHETGTAMLEI